MIKPFTNKYGGKVYRFDLLPKEAKLAVYMFIEYGENHDDNLKLPSATEITQFTKEHAGNKIGLVKVPMSAIVKALEKQWKVDGYKSFEEYHKWYLSLGDTPHHKTQWPCVLSSASWEVFEDGWHRFHSYYRAGAKAVPCLWFVKWSD